MLGRHRRLTEADRLTDLEEYQLGRKPTTADNIGYFVPEVADGGN
jgi:hypothetical protein